MLTKIELDESKESGPAVGDYRATVWVSIGKTREWDRLDAADSSGGMAESGAAEGARGRVLRTQSVGLAHLARQE